MPGHPPRKVVESYQETERSRPLDDRVTIIGIPIEQITPSTQAEDYSSWWSPGEGQTLAAEPAFDTPTGKVGLLNTGGPLKTKGHPFFEPIGENGRACVSCHQPANGMSL